MWKILLSSLAATAFADSFSTVHEKRNPHTGHAWKTRSIPNDAYIPVRIGLTQSNLDEGYDHLMNVAHPSSKDYAKYWDSERVSAMFAPSDETIDAVMDWLKQSGIKGAEQTSNKGWIKFDAPVSQAEALFQTKFHEYENPKDGTVRLGCDEYSLPNHIVSHVDYITPGIKLSPPVQKSKVKRSSAEIPTHKLFGPVSKPPFDGPWIPPAGVLGLPPDVQNCGVNITPACYRALYGIPAPTFVIPEGGLGIFENEDVYAQKDLNDFFHNYAPYVPNGTHPRLVSINGAEAPLPKQKGYDGGESDVDLDIAFGLLGPTNITLFQTAIPTNYTGVLQNLEDPFLDAIDGSFCDAQERAAGFQCGGDSLTTVLSASYETPELFYSTAASQKRVCNEFMKYSLQGHTIVFSSGDYGVAVNPAFGEELGVANGCVPRDLNNTYPNTYNGPIFSPNFPSTCPYVLSIGATQLTANQTVEDPESVMNVPGIGFAGSPLGVTFSSGGGFSNYFPRPSYQNKTVNNYLAKSVPDYKYYEGNYVDVSSSKTNIGKNGGVYNRGGRAIPDVSANGAYLITYNQGINGQFFGTSLATPLWAAIIAMINAERGAAGKGPVGFVHPTLYQNPQVFHDITVGCNAGCNTSGFPAVQGWDPSTGLGTPNYPALSKLFNSLP